MHQLQRRSVLLWVLGIALVVSGGWMVHQYRQLRACRRQRTADLQSLRELRETLQQYTLQKVPAEVEGQPLVDDYRVALARNHATI